jgi:alpha-mannosidase
MRKYFGDTYHGGIMCMHVFGKYAYHQPFFWDWSESIPQWLREYVFRRLDTLPGYKVNLEVDSSSFAYLKSRHPELIDHLKHYIHEGKLEIVDGTFAQPYNVLQSGESCIRHFYYGQKTIHDILGIYVKTYFKQEPLFFPQLPQILKKCSY